MIDCKALRDTAKGANCQVRLPGCTNRKDTTVWAHGDAVEVRAEAGVLMPRPRTRLVPVLRLHGARPVHRLLVLLPDAAIEPFQTGRYMAVSQAKFYEERREPR